MTSTEFLSLLEGEFMLNWLTALHSWACKNKHRLEQGASQAATFKKELGEFYIGWKGVLVSAAGGAGGEELLDDDMMCLMLHAALVIVSAAVGGGDMEAVKPPKRSSLTFAGAMERRRGVEREAEESRRRAAAGAPGGTGEGGRRRGTKLSFRDIVLAKAEELGVTVTMKDQMKEGKQVWSWGGKHSIYFDVNVVFVWVKEGGGRSGCGGGWQAISVDDLVELPKE